MSNNTHGELLMTWQDALKSGKYSDFTITCGSDSYKVHKAVVCTKSGFFERAARFNGQQGVDTMDLSDDESVIVKLLIQYFYEGEYEPKLPTGEVTSAVRDGIFTGYRSSGYNYEFPHKCDYRGSFCCQGYRVCPHHNCGSQCFPNQQCDMFICEICCPPTSVSGPLPAEDSARRLLIHSKMYEIGDKYDVAGLKELSREKFCRAASKYWDSEDFVSAAYHVFSSTPESDKGLREVVSNTISQHMVLLKKPEVKVMLTEFNGFA